MTGYRVYVGRQSRVYDSVLDVANQTVATITAPPGTSFYAVTAYNGDGLESDFSDEVAYAPSWSNSPPSAVPDNYSTTRNVRRMVSPAVGVLVNDVDIDPQPLSAVLVTPPANGLVSLAANGSFVYTPAQNFVGQDSFGYSVTDGSLTSAVATVTITVGDGVPGNQGCINCFENLDTLLAARGVEMQSVVRARNSVPTNITCPKSGVLIFGAVARAARALEDSELNGVIASTAECLTWNFANEVAEKSLAAGALLPSRWATTASNQANAAASLLAGVAGITNSMRQARLLGSAATILQRLENSIAAGNLAPSSLVNRSALAVIFDGNHTLPLTFRFSNGLFSLDDSSGLIAVGQYTFTRTAWNAGLLECQFNQAVLRFSPGQSVTIPLKFGRVRHRMTGETIRGYFTLQD